MTQRRGSIATGACIAAFGILFGLPALSGGATDEGKLRAFEAAPRATTSTPRTEPPLHGTNPHGQGTAAVVDLNPSAERPFAVDSSGNADSEDIIVGRARGEQRPDGRYHGHITILALMGNEILGVDTNPGESRSGPLEPVQQALLTPLCNGTANQICLSLVTADSTTTNTGSTNRFSAADVKLGGPTGLDIGAVQSNGNISSTADCQTSHGDSNVATVKAGGAVTADVARSATDSQACRGQAPTQTNSSVVLNLGGSVGVGLLGVPIPGVGCAEGVPDSETGLPLLLPIVCNADDTNGTQAAAPYGVRDALDVYVLATGTTALAKLSTASSESLAVAPAAATTPPPPPAVTPPPPPPPPAVTPPPPPPAVTTPATTTTPTPSDGGPGDSGDSEGSAGSGDGGGGAPECSDKVDNDGDGVIDSADPGCHSDGNANNPASYNPNDDSEANGAAQSGANKLPFTGADVLGVGLGGTLLLAAGLAIRGRARRPRLGS